MTTSDKKIAVQVKDLVTHYGNTEILHGVDMDVYEGEIMIIMGGSGSGKSTLMRYILGLGQPTSCNFIYSIKNTSGFPSL